ncbi:unnamed protein product, partial [Coregonus sp. 'balchen']
THSLQDMRQQAAIAAKVFIQRDYTNGTVLKKIAKFIQEQNDKIYAPRGLLLTDPIERGLRVVSFFTKQFDSH